MQKPRNFLSVMLSYLKIGTIGFGGGAALIPVIEKEIVENKKWIDKKRFDVSVAIASISPASLPISICTIWNTRYSILSAYSYALPGTLIYLILLTGFSLIGEAGAKYLSFASVGLISFVLFLLYRFIIKNYKHSIKTGIKKQYLLIMFTSFLLTCGNVFSMLFYMLFGIELPTSLFSIDMIILMLITFFMICFIGAHKSKLKIIIAIVIAFLFALVNGRAGILQSWALPLAGVMIIMVAVSIIYDVVTKKDKTKKTPSKFDFKPLRNLLLFILIAVLLTVITFVASGDSETWLYAFRVITSSLSSFGGGEVYIGISEVVFVQTGFIPENIYSTQIIGIANTMPGPVIVAIVAGIGYTYGSIHHSIGFGWLFGFLGFALTITATALGALTLFMFFEFLKDSKRLQMAIKYIMPVVCGMLISTALSLLRQASSVLISVQINPFLSVGIVVSIFILMLFLNKKFRMNDFALLLIGAAGTTTTLIVLDYLM